MRKLPLVMKFVSIGCISIYNYTLSISYFEKKFLFLTHSWTSNILLCSNVTIFLRFTGVRRLKNITNVLPLI